MPKAFNDWVDNNGAVRTISGPNKHYGLSKNQYVHVWIKNGRPVVGHVKTKKGKG